MIVDRAQGLQYITIGRDGTCDVRVEDAHASLMHATVVVRHDGRAWVEDNFSTNVTRVHRAADQRFVGNEIKLLGPGVPAHVRVELFPGDLIQIGRSYITWKGVQ